MSIWDDFFESRAKDDFDRAGYNAKASAYKSLKDISALYMEQIFGADIGRDLVIARYKEIRNLHDAMERNPGFLAEDEIDDATFIMSGWNSVLERYQIRESEIEAADLPYTTSTGRETASPVFKRRFD